MKIIRDSIAGTLESSDAMVYVSPHGQGIVLEINSSVGQQFYAQIEETVRAVLKTQGVCDVMLRLEDKGGTGLRLAGAGENGAVACQR